MRLLDVELTQNQCWRENLVISPAHSVSVTLTVTTGRVKAILYKYVEQDFYSIGEKIVGGSAGTKKVITGSDVRASKFELILTGLDPEKNRVNIWDANESSTGDGLLLE